MVGRRQERREERQEDRQLGRPGGGGNQYQMRQKMVSFGDDFWIENGKARRFSRWMVRHCESARL